jgi:hypothetical protein
MKIDLLTAAGCVKGDYEKMDAVPGSKTHMAVVKTSPRVQIVNGGSICEKLGAAFLAVPRATREHALRRRETRNSTGA